MRQLVASLNATPFGRAVYRPAQVLLHLGRRLKNPGLEPDLEVRRVSVGSREFSVVCRRWNESDAMSIDQCFKESQYEMPAGAHADLIDHIYREILASGKRPLIVDCGANIGASVLWFTGRYPEAHILAVEPSPENFALLRMNCAALDADLREEGVGPADGEAWMSDPWDAMGCRTNADGVGISVKIVSIATLLASKPAAQFTPFILKVDIEGAESSLFTGPASTLNQFPLILMEPHDWMLPGKGSSVEFFRFHAQSGREFAMKAENVASIACNGNQFDSFYAARLAKSRKGKS
jgi:FkbM family methyltransferase